jgi:hypothetical protein
VGGIRAFLQEVTGSVVAWAESVLPPQAAWLAVPLRRTLEYLTAPVTELGGRFHWLALLAALVLALWAYAFAAAPSSASEAAPAARPRRGLRGFLAYCFPRAIWRHRSTWVDLQVGFLNHLGLSAASNIFWWFTGAKVAAWITVWLTATLGPSPIGAEWGLGAVLVFTVLMSMAADFGYFLFHWASHRIGPLWEIHKLHHSAEVLSPLTTARVHPFERIVLGPRCSTRSATCFTTRMSGSTTARPSAASSSARPSTRSTTAPCRSTSTAISASTGPCGIGCSARSTCRRAARR